MEPKLVLGPSGQPLLTLKKTWSDSARAVAAEARKANTGDASGKKNEKTAVTHQQGDAGPTSANMSADAKSAAEWRAGDKARGEQAARQAKYNEVVNAKYQQVPGPTQLTVRVGPTAAGGASAGPFGKGQEHWNTVRVSEDTPTSTKVANPIEVPSTTRMKGIPGAENQRLSTSTRAVDYNSQLLQEKYGQVRGEKMYQDSIGRGSFANNPSAGPFLMHNKIQQEKLAMMAALGKKGHPDDHHYQGLYVKYHTKGK